MSTQPLKIVIVGGVAGGASAATRARRCNEQAEITVLEKDEHVSFANCGLPYHVGGEIEDRQNLLVATRALLQQRFQLDVRIRTEALSIDRKNRLLRVRDAQSGDEFDLPWDKLILSPGASPIVPRMEGADATGVFTLRNVADMDRIIEASNTSRQRKAVVVGAGFIGLEMAEQLVRRGFQVAVAELQPQVLPPLDAEMAVPLHDECERAGVRLCLGDGISRVVTDEAGAAVGVELQSGAMADGDLVILGLGVRPNTQLAQAAGLEIGSTGGITVNEYLQTSDPGIYAVGDACEYTYAPTQQQMRVALAGPANRAGRLAGEHAATGHSRPMAGVMGTAIVRVFELTAGLTGLSLKAARKAGFDALSATVVAGQHAGYFPGASPITLKLVYERNSGRVLGAQALGKDGVDKRLDVIATAMSFQATVHDLAGLDLAYAPPFGAAKDPIHQVAFTAANQLDGLDDLTEAGANLSDWQVVDVRTTSEVANEPLAECDHAINIPVDELRQRLAELDSSRPTLVSCGVGVRGHVAERILRQSGFAEVSNLSGGVTLRNRAVRSNSDSK
jgi:NADPH-dependent 2,4-dienoyl-CoA reductase/sulfur reductase-like enzyme/rhodanese-related sulfurtransferase